MASSIEGVSCSACTWITTLLPGASHQVCHTSKAETRGNGPWNVSRSQGRNSSKRTESWTSLYAVSRHPTSVFGVGFPSRPDIVRFPYLSTRLEVWLPRVIQHYSRRPAPLCVRQSVKDSASRLPFASAFRAAAYCIKCNLSFSNSTTNVHNE